MRVLLIAFGIRSIVNANMAGLAIKTIAFRAFDSFERLSGIIVSATASEINEALDPVNRMAVMDMPSCSQQR